MIYVVGLGPGDRAQLTPRAAEALEKSSIIIGYKKYIELIADDFSHKELVPSAMKDETNRCREALARSLVGEVVALVSGGDPGVYGMASLMLETAGDRAAVEIIPGVTAALAAGAILGAPLTHDFAVISLSDLLTPWKLIEKRLAAVSAADFVICIYNPRSNGRPEHFSRACDVIMRHRSGETPSGWVRNAGRGGESSSVISLRELRDAELDMFSTAFVGNSSTLVIAGKLVTPRGYGDK